MLGLVPARTGYLETHNSTAAAQRARWRPHAGHLCFLEHRWIASSSGCNIGPPMNFADSSTIRDDAKYLPAAPVAGARGAAALLSPAPSPVAPDRAACWLTSPAPKPFCPQRLGSQTDLRARPQRCSVPAPVAPSRLSQVCRRGMQQLSPIGHRRSTAAHRFAYPNQAPSGALSLSVAPR